MNGEIPKFVDVFDTSNKTWTTLTQYPWPIAKSDHNAFVDGEKPGVRHSISVLFVIAYPSISLP